MEIRWRGLGGGLRRRSVLECGSARGRWKTQQGKKGVTHLGQLVEGAKAIDGLGGASIVAKIGEELRGGLARSRSCESEKRALGKTQTMRRNMKFSMRTKDAPVKYSAAAKEVSEAQRAWGKRLTVSEKREDLASANDGEEESCCQHRSHDADLCGERR